MTKYLKPLSTKCHYFILNKVVSHEKKNEKNIMT